MSEIVIDASLLIDWLLPDEGDGRSETLFTDPGNQWCAPSHLPAEIGNVLLQSVKRGRLRAEELPNLTSALLRLDIRLEEFGFGSRWSTAVDLAMRHSLTLYDALYLELARRLSLPLATYDKALLRAAAAEGVHIAA